MINLFVTGKVTKDPQISKSLNALNWAFESRWDVFDFLNIFIKKILTICPGGTPILAPWKAVGRKEGNINSHPSLNMGVGWSEVKP